MIRFAELIQFWQDPKCKRNRTFWRKYLVFHSRKISYLVFIIYYIYIYIYICIIYIYIYIYILYTLSLCNSLIAIGYCSISQFLTWSSWNETDLLLLKYISQFECVSADSFVYLFPDIFRGFFNPKSGAFLQSPGMMLPELSSESANPWGV